MLSEVIIPSIFVFSKTELRSKLSQLTGWCREVHLDVTDNSLVVGHSFDLARSLELISQHQDLQLELHLMVTDPTQYWSRLKSVPGLKQIRRCVVHQESFTSDQELNQFLAELRQSEVEPVLTANPDHVLQLQPQVQRYQLMGVAPGKSGQLQLTDTADRVRVLLAQVTKQRSDISDIIVAIDGGIKPDNLGLLQAAGAKVFVVGQALWSHPKAKAGYTELKSIVKGGKGGISGSD